MHRREDLVAAVEVAGLAPGDVGVSCHSFYGAAHGVGVGITQSAKALQTPPATKEPPMMRQSDAVMGAAQRFVNGT